VCVNSLFCSPNIGIVTRKQNSGIYFPSTSLNDFVDKSEESAYTEKIVMTVIPIGLGRSSVALQNNRANNSLSSSTGAIARVEEQLYTQRQYQHGSDSPVNGTTTLSVQTQITRKTQNATNLEFTQLFLSATNSTLSKTNPLTGDAAEMALEALNVATTSNQRIAIAQTLSQTVQSLFTFANDSFAGRYLFAGATTGSMPFWWGADSSYTVKYNGSVNNIASWSNTDLLSQSNLNGADVFGAISEPMRGSDLNPA